MENISFPISIDLGRGKRSVETRSILSSVLETFTRRSFRRFSLLGFGEFEICPRSPPLCEPLGLNTWDRKPATSMALFTRGLEVLAHPKPPPLSNESTWWLDQCRCCETTPPLITLRPFIPDIPTKIQIAFSTLWFFFFFFSSVIDRQKADKEDKESIYPLRIEFSYISRSSS